MRDMTKQITFTDDGFIEVDGVLYAKVEADPVPPRPVTLLEIVRDWNDDDRDTTCLELVERIDEWLPLRLDPSNTL